MIKTREDANKYYSLVNKYIDKYIEEWNIKPSLLQKYLKKDKIVKFLKRHGLSEVSNIGQVIKDVIDDRMSMEADNILTFEKFNYEQKINLYSGIEPASLSHEKILADVFDTSLGHIKASNATKHIFTIEDTNIKCLVFTTDELDILRENVNSIIENTLSTKSVTIPELGVDIDLKNIIDTSKLKEIELHNLQKILCKSLNCTYKDTDWGFVGIINATS